jgi:hypothetical protein
MAVTAERPVAAAAAAFAALAAIASATDGGRFATADRSGLAASIHVRRSCFT